jgi:hypothetical protein
MDFAFLLTPLFSAIVILALVIGVLTSLIRQAVDYLFSSLKENFLWRDIVLPAVPFILAIPIYILSNKAVPQSILAYQAVLAASSSTYFYRLWKAYLNKAVKQIEDENK